MSRPDPPPPDPFPADRLFRPLARIEAYLDRALAAPAVTREGAEERPAALVEAMRYAALGGGKRLRPLLAWHWCEALGAPGERALPAAAAVEMVHAFSLVHDDLPALDNDNLRRGRPTLHRHAGEAMAILAGDQLLAEAFAGLLSAPGVPAPRAAALTRELALAAGRMISGQAFDMFGGELEGRPAIDGLRLVHRLKTGALIQAACRMGAICALPTDTLDESAPGLAAATAYGGAVGLMFQIVDDLLDAEQTAEVAGKRTGKDVQAGKLTYPGVIGVEASRKEVAAMRDAAVIAARRLGPGGETLAHLAGWLAARSR